MKIKFLGVESILVSIILFLFIFGVPSPFGSLTPLVTACLILWGLINYKKYFLYIPREFLYLIIFLMFDLIICLLIPWVLGTFDYSIIKTKINFMVSMIAVFVISKYFTFNLAITEKKFFNLLLCVFLIQTILIVLMLLSSDISNAITSFTRTSFHGQRVLESYAGARGLGFADSSAFGLAIVMGLFLFLIFYLYKNKYIGFKYFIFLLIFGGAASISAGRTSILGIILGIIYLFVNFKSKRSFVVLSVVSFVFFTLGVLLINIDLNLIQSETLRYFYSYSMEPILNYINTGSFNTSSTDALNNMYFSLTEKQFIIGDGLYMLNDKYYMETDAGYMRFSLFYGVIFSSLLYGFFIYFLFKMYALNNKHLMLFLFLGFFTFLVHYKGEVVLFAVSYNKLLFLILFFIYMRPMFFGKVVQ